MTTHLVQVDIAFLFQLAGLTATSPMTDERVAKALAVYQAAHRAIANTYESLATARTELGTPAYKLGAVAGFADPRDGAKVVGLWFSSTQELSKKALAELTALCSRCLNEAAYEADVACNFVGIRQRRKFETIEWSDIA